MPCACDPGAYRFETTLLAALAAVGVREGWAVCERRRRRDTRRHGDRTRAALDAPYANTGMPVHEDLKHEVGTRHSSGEEGDGQAGHLPVTEPQWSTVGITGVTHFRIGEYWVVVASKENV